MNKNIYNRIIFCLLLIFDFFSNLIAYTVIFKGIRFFDSEIFFHGLDSYSILYFQLLWFSIFSLFNLYDTRLTLSKFDEVIKIFPIIYGVIVTGISFDVFGFIDLDIEYKSLLSYSLLFSFIAIIGRFFIHTFQKYLLKKKIGLNNAVILGLNRRG